ncbi:MAG: TMEM128 family protein [Nitrososphaeraceae archaeon]
MSILLLVNSGCDLTRFSFLALFCFCTAFWPIYTIFTPFIAIIIFYATKRMVSIRI